MLEQAAGAVGKCAEKVGAVIVQHYARHIAGGVRAITLISE